MHVISCDENEAIVIGNRYTVRVLEILDDSVRLAIESPFEEPSYREEVIHVEPEYV